MDSPLRRRQRHSELPQHLPMYGGSCMGRSDGTHNGRMSDGSKKSAAIQVGLTVTALCLVLAFTSYSSAPSAEDVKFGHDSRKECRKLAQSGECISNRRMMLAECPQSCLVHSGVAIDTLSDAEIMEDAKDGFAFYHHSEPDETDCQDLKEECPDLALAGECILNDEFMLEHCPKSCLACFGDKPKTVTIDFGVEQKLSYDEDGGLAEDTDPVLPHEVLQIIKSSSEYMVGIYEDEEYSHLRRDCRNLDQYCSLYAAMGECHGETDALAMFQNCAPACHACESVAYYRQCLRRPQDIDFVPEGQLDSLFQRIIRESSQYEPTVLSQPTGEPVGFDEDPLPWIVYLDNFLSDEECEKIISQVRGLPFEVASEIGSEIDEDGAYPEVIGDGWNAEVSWCYEDCEKNPTMKVLLDRMLGLMKFPLDHAEYLEIIKYAVGGHYEEHQDVIQTQGEMRCGNRIISMYIFFDDVEEGGEIMFTEVEKMVTPKKGRLVIWNNVLNDDFNEMDDGTFKEMMPVKEGRSIGAQWFFHPRNIRGAWDDGCCDG